MSLDARVAVLETKVASMLDILANIDDSSSMKAAAPRQKNSTQTGKASDSEQTELEEMVSELLDLEKGLSDWEIDFLENIHQNWRGNYTAGQGAKIQKIYDAVIG